MPVDQGDFEVLYRTHYARLIRLCCLWLDDPYEAEDVVQEADLQPLAQEANHLREQLVQEWFKVMLEVRGILRPEQLTQAAQLKDQLRTLRHEMRSLLAPQP